MDRARLFALSPALDVPQSAVAHNCGELFRFRGLTFLVFRGVDTHSRDFLFVDQVPGRLYRNHHRRHGAGDRHLLGVLFLQEILVPVQIAGALLVILTVVILQNRHDPIAELQP